MARPRRLSRRDQVYAERKAKRAEKRLGRRPSRAELAKMEKIITPSAAPQIQVGVTIKPTTKKKLIPKIPTVKPRRTITAKTVKPRGPREILIVSRKGQPRVWTQVERLERKNYVAISVSSSWLATYSYFSNEKLGLFTTKTGRQYKILNFDFDTWEKWYYSHSKGTFWNDYIRDQYTIVGTL